MGAHSAWKLTRVVGNVANVLTIELLCAAQGIDLRAPLRPAAALAAVHDRIRAEVPFLDDDRPLHADIESLRRRVDDGSLVAAARAHLLVE